ncbi:hypothetical protein SEPCBS119000_005930 [Sporothrix epigloea]|uniref:Vhs domain containing protein n=1 Tax=Sporothrix epigloea TaxID=1892477 RepID=A0ABP0E074_9PEZI
MFSQKKPYSAVTVAIENLTGEAYEEDDLSGIPDLVEVIKLQATGPTEAARAIRKKLKYGSVHRQLRALTLLDGLIENAGPRFQRSFADEMLLERLRVCGTSAMVDPDVRKKCSLLFRSWAATYKNTPGMERLARLDKELPQRKQVVTQAHSRVIQETDNPFDGDEDEAESAAPAAAAANPGQASSSRTQTQPPSQAQAPSQSGNRLDFFGPASRGPDRGSRGAASAKSSGKDKRGSKKQPKPFNLEAERPLMKATIADASMASTDLTNTLQTINREVERISENNAAIQRFEQCKLLRRKILRYIYLVDSEEYLGSLLHANDELVTALMLFEQLDRSIDADSDSDDDLAEQAHRYRMIQEQAIKDKEAAGGSGSGGSPTSPVPDFASLNLGDATSNRSRANTATAPVAAAAPSPPPIPTSPRPLARPPAPPRPSAMSKPSGMGSRPAVPTAAMVAAAARNRSTADGNDSDGADSYVDDDENDPFADRNEVGTPRLEQGEHTW